MKETDLEKVLKYMKQYITNKDEHDSEPMLNWKDLKLVLEEIERLNSIIKEVREYIGLDEELRKLCINYDVNGIGILEILDKVSK